MERSEINLILTFRQSSSRSPEVQQQKFNETMAAGFWQMDQNQAQEKNDEPLVAVSSVWRREFKEGKKRKQIVKGACNLLQRAVEYADISMLEAEISINDDFQEQFSLSNAHSSEYFKTKSWK